ncbi:hypothetical protein PVAP13_7KG334600 [Panicum virgatum]|uniref:Uncharacterized protein n=1 Tax=Panicum virgatum TaxID=38727 RepID=A0A8T0QMT7_PANVG|nr:hypothetical protein PVAP13_7KG334600 [Panicum virgatum]
MHAGYKVQVRRRRRRLHLRPPRLRRLLLQHVPCRVWAAAARDSPAPPAPSFRRSFLAPRNPAPPCTGTLADRLFVPVSPRAGTAGHHRLQPHLPRGRRRRGGAAGHCGARAHVRSWRRSRRTCGGCTPWRPRAAGSGRAAWAWSWTGAGDGAMRGYFGNVLSIPYGEMGAGALRGAALADVARDVHRWVAEAATGEHFRELVDWVEARRLEATVARAYLGRGAGGEGATACVVSSGTRLHVGEVDFGWGRPAFASYHFPWPGGAGYVMPMPSARGDGEWVVYVHAAPEVVEAMEEEPTVFRALETSYMFG